MKRLALRPNCIDRFHLLDYAAQQHDLEYDKANVAGITGVLSLSTHLADLRLAQRSFIAASRSDLGSKEQLSAIVVGLFFLRTYTINSSLKNRYMAKRLCCAAKEFIGNLSN